MVRVLYVIYRAVETKSRRSVYHIQHEHHSITDLFQVSILVEMLCNNHLELKGGYCA